MKFNSVDFSTYFDEYPNEYGFFGKYGGAYIDEELREAITEVQVAYLKVRKMPDFWSKIKLEHEHFQGRPTPISYLNRISDYFDRVRLFAKREDLNYTGAHKLNHCIGEAILALYMGKNKVIGETGAGQHGVALATAAAHFGLYCDIYMGSADIKKQYMNVKKMELLGARVIEVSKGTGTLKDAADAAFCAYGSEHKNALYCIGSTIGPHPFPLMIRDFQSVIGREAREQFLKIDGKLPEIIIACVGGGSNASGFFSAFLADPVKIIGVEPLGRGEGHGNNAASLTYGKEGIMHGFKSIMLCDENGAPAPVYSIASGLDYPASSPELAFWKDCGRVEYTAVSDDEAKEAFFLLTKKEGIIPALESAHAVAYALKLAKEIKNSSILINLSGSGDKDIDHILSST